MSRRTKLFTAAVAAAALSVLAPAATGPATAAGTDLTFTAAASCTPAGEPVITGTVAGYPPFLFTHTATFTTDHGGISRRTVTVTGRNGDLSYTESYLSNGSGLPFTWPSTRITATWAAGPGYNAGTGTATIPAPAC